MTTIQKYKFRQKVYLSVMTGYTKDQTGNIKPEYMDIPMIIASYENSKYKLVRNDHDIKCECCNCPYFINIGEDKIRTRL